MRKRLDEIADVTKLAGFEFTKYMKYIEDGEIIAIRALNLKGGRLVLDDVKRIAKDVSEELPRSQLHKFDIVLSYTGTIGETAQIMEEGKYHLAPNVAKVVPKCDIVDPQYLFQYIRSLEFKQQMINYAHGSTQPTIPMATIRELTVPVYDIETEKRIASILSSIDDKIELNNWINESLLQQMESLYKAWFKDFIPFEGECPSDWKKSDIYSIADIIYGAPFSSKLFNTDGNGLPIIRIRDLKEQVFVTYTTEQHPKGHLIQPGDIVVGMDGEFRPYIWGNTEAWLNQRVCIFNNKRPKGKAFVLYTIKPLLFQIEQTQVATTVIHIGKKDYDDFEFLLPDDKTLDQFDSITDPMIDQIVVNSLENKRLAEMRDILLPKLMSGELDVSDLDF